MSLLKKNLVANFAGNIWQAIMGLAFVPLYIKFMGIESYGLIGIFATLQAMFILLDMGLCATLSREMARLSVLSGRQQEMRNLVRSLEVIYWSVAIFIGIVIIVISPFIAHSWVKAGQLPPQTIEQAFLIMGFVAALRWPAGFYAGGLMGLQQQVLVNAINGGMSTLRGAGAVFILWLISPTIQAFFLWQIIINIINTFLLAFFLWNRLPHTGRKASFQNQRLVGVWRFAAGVSGITILATILTQLDKIILSKMLTLEMFGYYTLAGVVAMSLLNLSSPISTAVFPKFTQLVSLNDQDGLKQIYHKSCQFVTVMILPAAAVIALFSYEIILIWTQNPVTAEKSHLLVSVLICGTALNGLMTLPYILQLAHGWTRLTFYTNLAAIIILVPLIVFLTRQYGALGGASVWVIINSSYVLFSIHFMHRRLLPSEKWRWYWKDVGFPMMACLTVAGLGRLLMEHQMSQLMMIVYLIIVSVLVQVVAALSTPTTRAWFFNKISNLKLAYGH